ncbi:MAG: hypothetical protein QOH76_118 [Thermoleophilaceae bacterium]|nr:hypothetical protein [Thermoleophilaceae bacterium]
MGGELVPGTELAGYRIDAVAGRGGMGVVYRATQLALSRTVALKVIAPQYANDPGFRARFKRESLVAASIEHPNVIAIHDAREEQGLLFLTMRYVEGTDLRAAIARQGRLEPGRAARIVAAVASALDAAHAVGLVHRDVKPANVLLASARGEEQVYLTDFGLTKQSSSESGVTKTGVFVGTLDYVSPEQLRGGPVDARTDVYSLGCVLYQALTGDVPYPRDSDVAKMFAHASEPPPSVRTVVPGLPAAFDAVIARAMAKEPAARYASAGELGRAAVAAASDEGATQVERTVASGAAVSDAPTAVGATELETPVAGGATRLVGAPSLTAAGGTVAPYAGAPTAFGGRRRRRRPALLAGAAALVAAIVVAVVLIGGGSSTKKASGVGFSEAEARASDYAQAHYPGRGKLYESPNCFENKQDPPDHAGATIGCFFTLKPAGLKGGQMTLHVTGVNPIQFGPVARADCKLDEGDAPC